LLKPLKMPSAALPRRRIHALRSPASAERALAETPERAEQENLAEQEGLAEQDKAAAQREALHLAGRLTLAGVFLTSAWMKAAAYDPAAAGRLGSVFGLSLAVELTCGAFLALGWFTRRAALVLLLWVGVGVVFFHGDLNLELNRVFALANVGIAGGLFVLIANGDGLLSLDRWLKNRRRPFDRDAK
jgi:putative oxidoreductase